MEQEDSDCFQLISAQDIIAIEQESRAHAVPSTPQLNQMYPSFDDEENGTLSIHIKNEDEQFMQPIRKASLVFEGWPDDDQQPLEEMFPEELSKTLQMKQEQPYRFQNERAQFNESIFTSRRIQPQNHDKQVKLQEKPQQPMEKQKISTPVSSKTDRKSSFIVINLKKKVKVVQKQGIFYWQFDFYIEIDEHNIQMLYDQMISRECFVPIFTFQLFQDWTNSTPKDRISPENKKYKIFRGYLQKYTDHLNQDKFYQSFCNSLIKINEYLLQGLDKKMKKRIFFNFGFHSLLDVFKKIIAKPKVELLRKTVLCKIESLQIARLCCEKYNLKKDTKKLKQTEQNQWKALSSIDLLLSLEATQCYCSKKVQSNSEKTIKAFWIRYNAQIKQSITVLMGSELESILL